MNMQCHALYGVAIASAIPLTGVACAGPADIVVRPGPVPPLPGEGSAPVATVLGAEASAIFVEHVGRFAILGGREIVMDPLPDASEPALRDCLVGPALALALIQRGRLMLHATAVVVDGHAVAFIGHSGAGKSTTAAAFHAAGCALVTDDFLPVTMDATEPQVHAGPARFKFLADVAAHFGAGLLPELGWRGSKQLFLAEGARPAQALRLARIYVLAEGAQAQAEALAGQAALLALLPHAGPLPRLQQPETAPYLRSCASLARRVPVVRLSRPRVLDALPQVVATVRADLRTRAGAQAVASALAGAPGSSP